MSQASPQGPVAHGASPPDVGACRCIMTFTPTLHQTDSEQALPCCMLVRAACGCARFGSPARQGHLAGRPMHTDSNRFHQADAAVFLVLRQTYRLQRRIVDLDRKCSACVNKVLFARRHSTRLEEGFDLDPNARNTRRTGQDTA